MSKDTLIDEARAFWQLHGVYSPSKSYIAEMMADFADKIAADVRAERERTAESFEDFIHRVEQWSKAYPTDVFPEIAKEDWPKIDAVLRDAGFSLTLVSASNMRHVITKIWEGLQPFAAELKEGE